MEEREKRMDIIALEEHFIEELEPCYDTLAGEGFEIRVPRGLGFRPVRVQVFPDTRIARLTTPLTDLTLRQAAVGDDTDPENLWLTGETDEEWCRVMLDRKGNILLASYVHKIEAAERTEWPAADGLSEESQSGSEANDTSSETPASTEGAPKPPEQRDAEGHERVNLTGRVGVEPRFRTTKNDTLVCTFPLAVHEDDGSTKWHDIVAFKERALKLQGSLHKGQEIELVGYVHTKQVPGKGGQPKEKREVWAAVVKTPKP
jgi:Single-strand binding protein family